MSEDDVAAATDRLLAGFDFARAATATEEAHRAELQRLLSGFIEVVDSIEALEAWNRTVAEDLAAARGRTLEKIRRQALRVLESGGVEPIISAGSPVDLATSEVVEVRVGGVEDVVVEEIVRGYRWRGQILRRARVAISNGDDA
jgi:molecular chaperone GrpE